jgi:uncharacterized repeat protein (TIGR02543 family)
VYSNAIDMACLLAISGNCWNPTTATPVDPNTVTLTINISGNNGTVNNSANTTTFNKNNNAQVTLTATPKTGYLFVNWTGDATGTNPTVTLTMSANKTVTANFKSTSPNLVSLMSWEAVKDALGSTVVIDSSKIKTNIISAACMTVKDADYNSYSSMEGFLDTVLTGATKITITYTSTKDFWFSLDQALSDGFGIDLPAASTSSTMQIVIGGTGTVDVKKPTWSTSTAVLNLSKIDGLSFDPATDADDQATAAISGSITISSITIDGYIGNLTPTIKTLAAQSRLPRTVMGVRAGSLQLSLPKSGAYSVGIYGINGKLIRTISAQCTAGAMSMDLKGIVAGEYIVRIGGASSAIGRIFINE